jgi:hypothetical protein
MTFHGRAGLKLRHRPPMRRGKSDHHIMDLPTVAIAAVVVVLLIAACVVRLVSH